MTYSDENSFVAVGVARILSALTFCDETQSASPVEGSKNFGGQSPMVVLA